MTDFQVLTVCVFQSDNGVFPPPAEMAQSIVDALLAKEPKLWSFSYPVEVVETKPKDPRWWLGKVLPFMAYTQPNMENRIVIFDTEADVTPVFRQITYPMKVTKLSANGLRFKVNDKPEMWVLAFQTQEKPE
jgi:hypothetical protein